MEKTNTHVLSSQRTYYAHIKYAAENPKLMEHSKAVMNRWNSGQITLAQAIAEALNEAYEAGRRKDTTYLAPPEAPPATPAQATRGVVRRRTR